ncbi:MAG: nickel-responsive transcriptional regulator NikR [Promethearchaeota archaeon]
MVWKDKGMARISITVPDEFLAEFDRIWKDHGYKKRSEAIRDAMRDFFKEKSMEDKDAIIDGFLIIAYNHEQRGLLDELTEIEHHTHLQVTTSMHIHVSQDNCSEVIAVRGKVGDVKEFKNQIQILKGIMYCELVPLYTTSSSLEHEHVHTHPHGSGTHSHDHGETGHDSH